MQTDAEPFLQRIRAFPDDDVPRLIFADWLDEQAGELPAGERDVVRARAEFVRIQIALARVPDDDDRRPALVVAERELLDAYREPWTAAFRGLATGLEFRRGFVERVTIDPRQYLRHAHAVFAAGPIRHIKLNDAGAALYSFLESAYLSRLSGLTLYATHAGEPLARALARCPHLAAAKELHLGRNRFGDDAAEHLAGSPVFANVEELDLAENELGETGARTLAASPHLGAVKVLELRNNQLGPAGAEAVAGSERLTALTRLGLAGNDVGTPRLHALSRASDLLRVPVLDLSMNGLNAAALKVILARPPADVRLRELDLSHNELGDVGARLLAETPHLAGLAVLRLAGCGITGDGTPFLANSPHLNRLVVLDLANNPVNDVGFRAYLETPHLRSLRRLIVPGIGISLRMRRALDMRFYRAPLRV
ncbi:MAG: TIGR02996 domain-containing protein [Gemmataceae bacterium]|nr:TIGR02996 domain-containing protein [Gemmataceae bacterium]